jgi:putative zinc finger protein
MNCRSAETLFSSYIEDEISQEERRNIEAHLLGCRRCSLALRDVKATMSMLEGMPLVAPSAHFDEDVYAKIRSGEGLRPSARELVLELLAPLRLRPLVMAGAGVCAVAVAFAISPVGQSFLRPAPVLTSASRTPVPAAVVPGPSNGAGSSARAPDELLAGRTAPPAAPSGRSGSVVASASSPASAGRDSIVDGRIQPRRYTDEIINDQFYLERGGQGQNPSVVPVSETQDDGVYIIF